MFFVLGRLVSGFLGCEVIKRESKLLSRCEKGRHYCFRLPCWAASLESAHAWTVQNDRDVPCTVSHLAAYGSSGFQGSIMRLAPVPVAYHLCPLQALDAMALLSHTRCFDTASLSSY